jgi:hypothetical protein
MITEGEYFVDMYELDIRTLSLMIIARCASGKLSSIKGTICYAWKDQSDFRA